MRTVAGELANHGRAWLTLARRHRSISNFGDALNPIVIRELLGTDVEWAPLGREDLVCIGSVLDTYVRDGGQGRIFGSGSRTGMLSASSLDPNRVVGVRGLRTAAALGLPDSAAIGDPGLAIRNLVASVPVSGRGRPVVLPHFSDFVGDRKRVIDEFARRGYDVVLPNMPPLEIAAAVGAAEHVLTTSLHAVVFADALDVPVSRVHLADEGKTEPEFKYDDYRSVFGISCPKVSAESVLANGIGREERAAMDASQAAVSERIDQLVNGLFREAKNL
jgi:pyruvyltransferase